MFQVSLMKTKRAYIIGPIMTQYISTIEAIAPKNAFVSIVDTILGHCLIHYIIEKKNIIEAIVDY